MAANTDKLRKKKSLFSTTLSGNINDTVTTIGLNSTTGLATDTAITLTIDRVDGNGDDLGNQVERVTGVISGSNLTNALRGQDSTTAQSHNSGGVVEDIWDADTWNDLIDALLVEHGQDGKHSPKLSMYIPAPAMWPSTTNGCADLAKTELTTNDVDIQTLDFDTTTQEHAQFAIRMPGNWDAGTVTFIPVWTAASGSGGVSWALQGRAFANDDALDQAWGTEQNSDDTLLATDDLHQGPESSAITLAGTPAAGEFCQFRIFRDVADAQDTIANDVKLLGIYLIYTTDALPTDS